MAEARGVLRSRDSMAILVPGGPVAACVDGCDVSIGSHVLRMDRPIAQAMWFRRVLILREASTQPDPWNDNVVALDPAGTELWRAASPAEWRYAPYVAIEDAGGCLIGVTAEGVSCEIDLENGSIVARRALTA